MEISGIRPIKTEAGYEAAHGEVEALLDAASHTPEADRLDLPVTLIQACEAKRSSIPLPDPITAIEYCMESRGLTRRDLEQYIGSRARVSEILNRKRPLTIDMIRRLHAGLGIPAEVLIQPYRLRGEAA